MSAFDKVIGYENLKLEMMIICDAMKNPERYSELGVKVPKGVLLYGEPGIGKSLMAKAIVEESGRKSFTLRKDKPDGAFVNQIREVFELAKAEAPSIIFLDDMDKFANGDESHKDAEEYVTIQTGIETVKDLEVFIVATANDKDVLPDSLIRSGRFDKVIEMTCPEGEDAEKIVKHFLDQKRILDDVDSREIARILDGRSCADLETIINEAGMYTAFEKRDKISHHDIIRACLRYVFDAPEEMESFNDSDRKAVAIHEAGHAAIAEILDPGSVNLISISGYSGNTRGITSISKPKGYWDSKELMEHRVIGLLGGKAATEVVSGIVDVGAISDIRRAFNIVERFVDDYCSFGFNSFDRKGASNIPKENRDIEMASEIEKYYQMAKKIILENAVFLNAIIDELMMKHTITGKDINKIKDRMSKSVA